MRKALIIVCAAVLLMHAVVSHAQATESANGPVKTPATGQPVVLGDTTVFTLQDVLSYSALERANTVTRRIQALAENPRIDPAAITTDTYPQPITLINAGGELVMVVFDEDAKAEGRSRPEVAADWCGKIRAAIVGYRQSYALEWIMKGIVRSLIATAVLILVLIVIVRTHRKLLATLHAWMSRKGVSIHIQSLELVTAARIGGILSNLLGMLRLVLILISLYAYLHFVLRSFPWTAGYASQILQFVIKPFRVIGTALLQYLPNLFFVVIIFGLAYYAVKLMGVLFAEVEKGSVMISGFYPEWAQPTFKICRVLVIAVAAIMAFPYVPGSDSPAFKGISIFIGVLLSLGSTSTIANVLAGFSLIYRRAFKVGDRVKIADFMGDVMEIRLEVTHLRTIKNEEIVVPNSMIISSHVTNYSSMSQDKGLILHTTVTIGYDAPWRQVHALLLEAARRTPGLLSEPAPFILQTSLDDFYVSYQLNVYCNTPWKMVELYSDLHLNIQDSFNEYGVQIMSPWYRFDPDKPKVVPKDQWYASPAQSPDSEFCNDR